MVAAALGACTGAVEDDEQESRATMALSHGGQDRVALVEVGVDSATYTRIVEALGTEPEGLVNLGSEAGALRIEMSPGTPTTLFAETVEAAGGQAPMPAGFEIDFSTDTKLIGLLLPAVQKVRALGTDTDANDQPTLFIDVQTEGAVLGDVQAPPQQAAIDSFFDISYDLVATISPLPDASPDEVAAIGALTNPAPVEGNIVLEPDTTGAPAFRGGVFVAAGDVNGFAEASPRVSIAFDVRGEDAAPLLRVRLQGAQPIMNIGSSGQDGVSLGTSSAPVENTGTSVITFTGLELASTDADALRGLFNDQYADYEAAGFGRASALFQPFMDTLLGDPDTAVAQWQAGSVDPMLGVFAELLLDTVDREAMACSLGVPFAVEAGQAMDPDVELAAIVEEASTLGDIMSGFHEALFGGAGNDILIGGFGHDRLMDQPAVACSAVIAMSSALADGPVDGFSAAKRDALIGLGRAIDSARAAYLARIVIDFKAHMDAAPVGEVIGSDWLVDARSKAGTLLEVLEATEQAARDAHGFETEMVQL